MRDYADPDLIYIPKQMTREELKTGFREFLNRVFDVAAYFDRVFDGRAASTSRRHAVEGRETKGLFPRIKRRLRRALGEVGYAFKFALLSPGQGRLSRHLRACASGPLRNAS